MNVPLVPILVTSILYVRIPWVHTHARVIPGTQEMENFAMVYYIIFRQSTSTRITNRFYPDSCKLMSGFKICGLGERIHWFRMDKRPIRVKK